jgi:general secretion pathway protein I
MHLRQQRGMTILEVLVAFVIAALSLSMLLQMLGSSVSALTKSRDYTQAGLWAQSKMDSLGLEEPLEEGSDSGKFDDQFRYQLEVTSYQPQDADTSPVSGLQDIEAFNVQLTVQWKDQQSTYKTIKLKIKQP